MYVRRAQRSPWCTGPARNTGDHENCGDFSDSMSWVLEKMTASVDSYSQKRSEIERVSSEGLQVYRRVVCRTKETQKIQESERGAGLEARERVGCKAGRRAVGTWTWHAGEEAREGMGPGPEGWSPEVCQSTRKLGQGRS